MTNAPQRERAGGGSAPDPGSHAAWQADAAPGSWRRCLLGLGHWPAVALLTAISVVLSVLISALLWRLDHPGWLPMSSLVPAVVVPVVVAPLVSYYAVGLLFEIESSRQRLHEAAIRDSLTQAYNRRFFMARLEIEVGRAWRTARPLSVLMIDIDHFKSINDAHGHAVGDRVLETVAQTLSDRTRPYDVVARFGGEEFVVLMPGATLTQAADTAERIRGALESLRIERGTGLRAVAVTASLGLSCLRAPGPGESGEALLERADRAMYAAKHGGRNRCVCLEAFDPSRA